MCHLQPSTAQGSAYRYALIDFEQVLQALKKFNQYPCLICGHLNLLKVNWSLSQSADEYEHSMIEMFEQHNFHQLVDFRTRGKNTLDLVFERKVENTTAKIDLVFKQLFNVSDHEPQLISIEKHSEGLSTRNPVSIYFRLYHAARNDPVSFQGYMLYLHRSHD